MRISASITGPRLSSPVVAHWSGLMPRTCVIPRVSFNASRSMDLSPRSEATFPRRTFGSGPCSLVAQRFARPRRELLDTPVGDSSFGKHTRGELEGRAIVGGAEVVAHLDRSPSGGEVGYEDRLRLRRRHL